MIVRRDLPTGFRDAQQIHAAYAAGRMLGERGPEFPFAITLAVPDEPALLALADRLERAGIAVHLIREPDPPWDDAATALALPIAPKSAYRRFLSSLPTLKEDKTPR